MYLSPQEVAEHLEIYQKIKDRIRIIWPTLVKEKLLMTALTEPFQVVFNDEKQDSIAVTFYSSEWEMGPSDIIAILPKEVLWTKDFVSVCRRNGITEGNRVYLEKIAPYAQ